MRIVLSFLILATLLKVTPALAESRHWHLRQNSDEIIVAYEVPDTDDQPLMFSCTPQGQRFEIRFVPDHGDVTVGWRGRVEFSSEAGQVKIAMWAEADEDDGMVLEGSPAFSKTWAAMLGQGKVLKIHYDNGTDEIKLDGMAQSVAAIDTACGTNAG